MVLPGAHAFLGFQFAIVFVQGFEQLPHTWQLIGEPVDAGCTGVLRSRHGGDSLVIANVAHLPALASWVAGARSCWRSTACGLA